MALVGNTGHDVIHPKVGVSASERINHFKLPKEAHPSFGGYFDPDFGLGPIKGDFTYHQELTDIANARLAKYGYTPISKEDRDIPCDHIASEVGDDEETLFRNKAMCGYNMAFHVAFGMKVSEEDTCVNSQFGNFAEDLIVLPNGYYQTYHNTRNTSHAADMAFLDVPKIRLAIDIRPMRMEHSSTNDGKASMLGARNSWIPRNHKFKVLYEVFNLFQDIHLGLIRDKRFAYLPQSLGGYGKEIPFSQPENLERFLKAYKNGQHSDLIRDIVRRSNTFLEANAEGKRPKKDPLLSHCVRYQSTFHDWIKGKSIYAPVAWIDIPAELVQHQVGKLGESPARDDVIGRLINDRILVTESQLQVAVEHNYLCEALLKAETIPEFKKTREKAIRKWMESSIFSMESYGLIKELNLLPDRRKLRGIDVSYFMKLVKEHRYNLKTLMREEMVYWREALNTVYHRGPMMVPFRILPKGKEGYWDFAEQSLVYRQDIPDTEELDAHEHLIDWLKSDQTGPVPRVIINDDHNIIREASKYRCVAIVTDDCKLCRRCSKETGNPVFRVPVEWYMRALYFGDNPSPWMDFLKRKTGLDFTQLEDTGSIQSFEEGYFHDGLMCKQVIRCPFDVDRKEWRSEKLIKIEADNYTDSPPDYINPDDLLYDSRNVLNLRRRHKNTHSV